jgi:prevent-host-death family protein
MQAIGAFQAKTHFSTLLRAVEKGEHIIITKHGQAVAQLIPATGSDYGHTKQAILRLKQLAKTHRLGGLDWKILRDEGRR